jgi:chromosome segregation ATPase
MADNQREIERLQRQISNANRELRNIERDYNDRIKQETAKMRREMQNFSANLKQDYIQKLQEMEQSFSNAYLNEMERMRRRYNELTEQVAIYENELNEAMERLEAEQARLIQENKAKNQQYEEAANKAVQKLKQSIQDLATHTLVQDAPITRTICRLVLIIRKIVRKIMILLF